MKNKFIYKVVIQGHEAIKTIETNMNERDMLISEYDFLAAVAERKYDEYNDALRQRDYILNQILELSQREQKKNEDI